MSLADQQWSPTSTQVTVLQARGLRIKGKSGTNDAYAVMQVGKEKFQTSVVEKSVVPVWKEEATFDLPPTLHQGAGGGGGGGGGGTLHVQVLHRALVGPDKLLGQANINLLHLSEDKTRKKTEWFKLLDKTGKHDKDRGEVLVDIQFLRNNMTTSMFDLSAAGKSRSRLGKFKDKVRGKKKESDTLTNAAPTFSQVLTDSEEEGLEDVEVPVGKDGKKKVLRVKSLFSPKSNLQKNMSQSMSVLPAKNSSLSGSQSYGLNSEASDGKKKFKFSFHKRSGSDNKDASSHQKHVASEQSNLCINGSHIYCEEPQPRTSRIGSNYSIASSGHGSMEDVPDSSPPSVDSLRAMRQYSPWTEEEEEGGNVGGSTKGEESELRERKDETAKIEEERRRKEEKELERLAEERVRREEEERIMREEEENRVRRQEEEIKRLAEERRKEEDRRRNEEAKLIKEEEERQRQEEEERVRREEEEHERLAEEKRRLKEQEFKKEEQQKREEEERKRLEEERVQKERREREEEERQKRLEEERIRLEEQRVQRERREEEERQKRLEEERIRLEEQQVHEENRRREEEERQKREEERIRLKEERAQVERRRREEEERQKREEEERIRLEEERKQEEKRRREEEERQKREEEERIRLEEERAQEEKRRREEEERQKREEEERIRLEGERAQEEKRRREEEERQKREEERRLEEEQKLEEERRILEEEDRRKIEEEKVKEEARIKIEEERRKKEEEMMRRQVEEDKRRVKEQERQREEEERIRNEEEVKRLKEEYERLLDEKKKLEEEERKRTEEEEKKREEEEERKRLEEECRRLEEDRRLEEERRRIEEEKRLQREEEERVRREKEEYEQQREEERRRIEEEEKERKEEQKRIEEEERKEKEERVRKEKEENERLAEEVQKREREERVKKEKEEEEARKLEEEEEQKKKECKTKKAAGRRVEFSIPEEVTSTNPFDENYSLNPFEEISCSPSEPDRCTSSTSTNEKDLGGSQREKRAAPQPPGRPSADRHSQKEQDASATRHVAQINKQSKDKDAKQSSLIPKRSVKKMAPVKAPAPGINNTQTTAQSSPTKATVSVVKPGKRIAPSRPVSSEIKPPQASGGNISEPEQEPIGHSLNPFEDNEDENEPTAEGDTTTSSKSDPSQWPPHVSEAADGDTASQNKTKSSKMVRAPLVPAATAATANTLIDRSAEEGLVTDKRKVSNNTKAQEPKSDAKNAVIVKEGAPQESQHASVKSTKEDAGGKKEVPPAVPRRLQPVKPLNTLEQQSNFAANAAKETSSEILCEVQEQTKVNDTALKGPYSQLTQQELISMVLKQETMLTERDEKISQLEQYIDNLLVRVIEEAPTILMSINSLKKTV